MTKLKVEDKTFNANADAFLMQDLHKEGVLPEANYNKVALAKKEFDDFFVGEATVPMSSFSKETFERQTKFGGVNTVYNQTYSHKHDEYDINKSRTGAWLKNELGPWCVFNICDDIQPFSGDFKKPGYYYVTKGDPRFFLNGTNKWYPRGYLLKAIEFKYHFDVKYEHCASTTLPEDYFKKFVEYMIKKYGEVYDEKGKPIYKFLVNVNIGCLGKTFKERTTGYIEADYDMAVAAFLENNDQKIGFWADTQFDKRKMKVLRGKTARITPMEISQQALENHRWNRRCSEALLHCPKKEMRTYEEYIDPKKDSDSDYLSKPFDEYEHMKKFRGSVLKEFARKFGSKADYDTFWDYENNNYFWNYDDFWLDVNAGFNNGVTWHYLVETTTFETLYNNHTPIYNQILANEYFNLFLLMQSLQPCRIIKLKTDAVIVEGRHTRPKLSDEILGIKHTQVDCGFIDKDRITKRELGEPLNVETELAWKQKKFSRKNVDENILKQVYDLLETQSCLIRADAGAGKSHFIQSLPVFSDPNTIRLGFSGIAVDNVDSPENPAHTLNQYFHINWATQKVSKKGLKSVKNLKPIIITECFTIPSYIMKVLSFIKVEFPHIQWILEGDNEQTPPVKEQHIDWYECKVFYDIVNGNEIYLTDNYRNNETENYNKIKKNERLPENRYEYRKVEDVSVFICKTNRMRKHLNWLKMNKLGVPVKQHSSNPYSQDCWLEVGTPIMCLHNFRPGLRNGSTFFVEELTDKYFTIAGEQIPLYIQDEDKKAKISFQKDFTVCYAFTNHKLQGGTVKEPKFLSAHYNIYEWEKMVDFKAKKPFAERYAAYSRCTTEFPRITELRGEEAKMLPCYGTPDQEYTFYKWTCSKSNDIYVGSTNNFNTRKKAHLKSCANPKDKQHFKLLYQKMRLYGIECWTMEVLEKVHCLESQVLEKEQEWKDRLNANLNMIEPCKERNLFKHYMGY